MNVAVATIARGRDLHLARQGRAVARMDPPPARYVVLSMNEELPVVPGADVVALPVGAGEPLPLAAARNRAVEAAGGVELVVMLDVDCLPATDLLAWMARAAAGDRNGHLLAGPVGRLRAGEAERWPDPRASARAREAERGGARPVPALGELIRESRYELFWSLAFAVTPALHERIGGFDEGYRGYGAEDTDYAFRAREAGVGFSWVGGAWSYHQHHPISNPPVEHLDDIVRNARRFHRRFGRWPMEGWLAAFAERGLIEWSPGGSRLEQVAPAAP